MSTATIELSSTRRKLFDVLGDNQQQYLDHLKVFLFIAHSPGQSNNVIQAWFRKRCSKEEFDAAARKLLTQESVHLHNQFLLAVWMPCKFRYSPHESFTFEGAEQVPDAGEHCSMPSTCKARATELKHP